MTTATTTAAYEIGKRLVELCRQAKNVQAIDELYSPDIVSIEPQGGPNMPARQQGLAAIKAKNQWWLEHHEIHGSEAQGPFPHGDRFIALYKWDVTPKSGPMAGKRFTMQEAALYTVKDEKIVQEEFFYHMG